MFRIWCALLVCVGGVFGRRVHSLHALSEWHWETFPIRRDKAGLQAEALILERRA